MEYISLKQFGMLQLNTILISGTINNNTSLYISEALVYIYEKYGYRIDPEIELPTLTIKINSLGGSVAESFWISLLLKMYKGKTIAIVEGLACSAAVIILQACAERCAYSYSKILIHNTRAHSEQFQNSTLFKCSEKKQLEKTNEDIYKVFMERTGKSFDTIKYHCSLDISMNSKEALEFGLLDKIIPFPLLS